jgi:hypothetical protein
MVKTEIVSIDLSEKKISKESLEKIKETLLVAS